MIKDDDKGKDCKANFTIMTNSLKVCSRKTIRGSNDVCLETVEYSILNTKDATKIIQIGNSSLK